MILMLGMVSGANAWNQSQSMSHAGQVAARFASTTPTPDEQRSTWTTGSTRSSIASIAASTGTMDAGTAGRAICVAYVDPAGAAPDKTASRRIDAAGTRTLGTTECFSDGQGTTAKRVQVVMERDRHDRDRLPTAHRGRAPHGRLPIRGRPWSLTAAVDGPCRGRRPGCRGRDPRGLDGCPAGDGGAGHRPRRRAPRSQRRPDVRRRHGPGGGRCASAPPRHAGGRRLQRGVGLHDRQPAHLRDEADRRRARRSPACAPPPSRAR